MGTQALMGSRCTTAFHQNTGTLIYEGPLLAPHPEACARDCVCVCVNTAWFVQILNKCLDVDHPYCGQTKFNCFCVL